MSSPSSPTARHPPPDAPIVLIVFENRPFSQIAGHAPYLNGLAAQGRLFTHDVAIVHPSLPNYMAFSAGSTLGCSTDSICSPNTLSAENIYHQLEVAGISWNAFAEHMPTNCGLNDSGSVPNKYIAHHNPVVYFTNVHAACLLKSKPYSQIDPAALPGSRSSRRGTSTTCTTGRSRRATPGRRRTSSRSSMPGPR